MIEKRKDHKIFKYTKKEKIERGDRLAIANEYVQQSTPFAMSRKKRDP